jgi:hypothetical protein
MARNLTAKEALFVHSYMQSGNATRAAKEAGYSAKTAGQAGCRLLKSAKIKAEIERVSKGAMAKVEEAADAAIERYAVTAGSVIESLARMGLAHDTLAKFLKVNGGDLEYDFTGATPEELLAIAPMVAELTTERYMEGRGAAAREVIRSKVKFVDRKGVLELLGRWKKLGMWQQPPQEGDNHIRIHVTRRVVGQAAGPVIDATSLPKQLEQHATD